MSATVLLIGGFGNLGGRIASFLATTPDVDIILASRIRRQAPIWAPNVQTIQLDLTTPDTFTNIPKSVTSIVQLAALNDTDSAANPTLARQVTTGGTSSLLQEAIRRNIQQFVYFSTAHVYGAPLVGHLTETTPTHPVHPYATTHLDAEAEIEMCHLSKQVQGLRIRLSNGFGRPMDYEAGDWKTLVSDLCVQAVSLGSMHMHTDGLQERNFITKQDIARAVHHLINLDNNHIGNGLFNMGGTRSHTLLSMAHQIQARAQFKLNKEIPLHAPSASGTLNKSLNFDSNKLAQSGFLLQENFAKEVDDLLDLIMSKQKR